MKPKHQRLALVAIALVALLGAAVIAGNALREEASYFHTPTTLLQAEGLTGKAVRLGGMVMPGSLKRSADGVNVRFVVQDKSQQVSVVYQGITPDLFTEGSGVTADGKLRADGVFEASSLLAKHDENYVPVELQDMDQAAAERTKETLAK